LKLDILIRPTNFVLGFLGEEMVYSHAKKTKYLKDGREIYLGRGKSTLIKDTSLR
jgi:hypothetical protein